MVVDEAFARQHPTLQVGEHVRLSVSDTGIGMDEHVKQHLFEPFFTTKEPGKGTGLGLATCYGIVQQLGGDIYPESELGKGTMFNVFLPRVDLPAEPTPRPRETGVQRGTETVLLVEDEPLVREIAESALSDQGYQVLEAEHGEEALRVASEHGDEIALVLTDVVMPKMGGRELVEQLRKVAPGDPRALHVRLRGRDDRRAGRHRAGHGVPAQAVRARRDAAQGARGARRRRAPRRSGATQSTRRRHAGLTSIPSPPLDGRKEPE